MEQRKKNLYNQLKEVRRKAHEKHQLYTQARTTRNTDVQLAFHGKKALGPIIVFSIFSERLDQFG